MKSVCLVFATLFLKKRMVFAKLFPKKLMEQVVALIAFFVAIVAFSVGGSVKERLEVPVDTRVFVQRQTREVERSVADALKPVAQKATEASTLGRQYATLADELRNDVTSLRTQIETLQRTGADVSALTARVDAIDASLARVAGDRKVALDAITLDISNRTNDQLASATERMSVIVDERVKAHNEALRLLPVEAAGAVRAVSGDSFLALDTANGRSAIVSKSPLTVGRGESVSGGPTSVDLIIDQQAVGFGDGGRAFTGLQNDSLVTVSPSHVFAAPGSQQQPFGTALARGDFRPLVRIDGDGGVHLQHHKIMSSPEGLDVCNANGGDCVRVVSTKMDRS